MTISHKLRVTCAALFAAALSACVADRVPAPRAAAPDGYVVFRSMQVDSARSGFAGRIEVLQDKRVTPELRDAMWRRSADPRSALSEDDPLSRELADRPLRPARLRLIGDGGVLRYDEELAHPLADLATTFLYGNGFPTYLVTYDDSAGFGTYSGLDTGLVEIREGRLLRISSVDADGRMAPIRLRETGKAGWRIEDAGGAAEKKIRAVSCHPAAWGSPGGVTDGRFVTDYSTYRYDGGNWRKTTRTEAGTCQPEEEGDEWPDASHFP